MNIPTNIEIENAKEVIEYLIEDTRENEPWAVGFLDSAQEVLMAIGEITPTT